MFWIASLGVLLLGLALGQLHLNTIDAIDAVNEQDQDEDERNLFNNEPFDFLIVGVDPPSCHIAALQP